MATAAVTPAEADRSARSWQWLVHDEDDVPVGEELRVWLPAALTQHAVFAGREASEAAARLRYVVIDEIVDDSVGLTISAWPYADAEGRLRFLHGDRRLHVGVGRAQLEEQLYEEGRTARIGDVFAAELKPEWHSGGERSAPDWVQRPDELFRGTVYDLTAAARTVGKLAYYGAVASVLSRSQAAADNLLELEQPPESAATERQLPSADEAPHGQERDVR